MVQIEAVGGTGTLHRGETRTFKANVSDDGDALTYDWGHGETCPNSLEEALAQRRRIGRYGEGELQLVTADAALDHFCVFVIVTDDDGAKQFAAAPIDVIERQLILTGPDHAYRGEKVPFTATFKDEPETTARARYRWASGPTCPAAEMAPASAGESSGKTWIYDPKGDRSPFCVAVTAFDDFGVGWTKSLMVATILNHPPEAGALELVTPPASDGSYGILTDVRVSAPQAHDADPGDVVTYAWTITGGDAKPCANTKADDPEFCVTTGAKDGMHEVQLIVRDGTDSAAPITIPIHVHDAAPCITFTEPTAAKSFWTDVHNDPTFKVSSVVDDGDPLPLPPLPDPASARQFIWYIRRDTKGPFETIATTNQPAYTLTKATRAGADVMQVRLEYRDRVTVAAPRAREALGCNRDDLVCELPANSGCFTWVTWTVVF
jgi:hypothetical protein